MSPERATPAIVVAGAPDACARLAGDLLDAGLEPVGVLCPTPGGAAEAAARRPDRIVPIPGPGRLRGAEAILLAGGPEEHWREIASAAAGEAADAVIIVTGADSSLSADRFLLGSRLEPQRILATGHLPGQLLLERSIAERAGVSRSQVSALVIGGVSGAPLPLWRHVRVAGLPLSAIAPFLEGEAGTLEPESPEAAEGLERRAAVLMAGAVLHDRRRILCCGARRADGSGLPEGLYTLPSVIGRRGLIRTLEVGLTLAERSFLSRGGAGS